MKLLNNTAVARRRANPQSTTPCSGFSLSEFTVAVGIMMMVGAASVAFVGFVNSGLSNVATQNQVNQKANFVSGAIMNRVRDAIYMTNDSTGNKLVLAFDDNPNTDSNNDGNKYNDRDHYESYTFDTGDGLEDTTSDNRLYYKTNINTTSSMALIERGLRKLPSVKVFDTTNSVGSITNGGNAVRISFGILDGWDGKRTQTIEIKNMVVRRN